MRRARPIPPPLEGLENDTVLHEWQHKLKATKVKEQELLDQVKKL
jgi:hypothetical protein